MSSHPPTSISFDSFGNESYLPLQIEDQSVNLEEKHSFTTTYPDISLAPRDAEIVFEEADICKPDPGSVRISWASIGELDTDFSEEMSTGTPINVAPWGFSTFFHSRAMWRGAEDEPRKLSNWTSRSIGDVDNRRGKLYYGSCSATYTDIFLDVTLGEMLARSLLRIALKRGDTTLYMVSFRDETLTGRPIVHRISRFTTFPGLDDEDDQDYDIPHEEWLDIVDRQKYGNLTNSPLVAPLELERLRCRKDEEAYFNVLSRLVSVGQDVTPINPRVFTLLCRIRKELLGHDGMFTPTTIPEAGPDTQDAERRCAICMEDIEEAGQEPFRLDCSNSCNLPYHRPCLQHWILEKGTCPSCRTSSGRFLNKKLEWKQTKVEAKLEAEPPFAEDDEDDDNVHDEPNSDSEAESSDEHLILRFGSRDDEGVFRWRLTQPDPVEGWRANISSVLAPENWVDMRSTTEDGPQGDAHPPRPQRDHGQPEPRIRLRGSSRIFWEPETHMMPRDTLPVELRESTLSMLRDGFPGLESPDRWTAPRLWANIGREVGSNVDLVDEEVEVDSENKEEDNDNSGNYEDEDNEMDLD
jgi:hypothetical protein